MSGCITCKEGERAMSYVGYEQQATEEPKKRGQNGPSKLMHLKLMRR